MTENKLGVLQVNESLARTGGAEAYINDLSHTLQEMGVSVRMCSGQQEELRIPEISYIIRRIHKETDPEKNQEIVLEVKAVLSNNGLNLIHLHNIGNSGLITTLINEIPMVRTIHDSRPVCPKEHRLNSAEELCIVPVSENCITCCGGAKNLSDIQSQQKSLDQLNSLDLVLTPSQYTKDQLILNGVLEKNIKVIPLFAPLDLDVDVKREESYASNFLFLGRVTRSKGLREALVALSNSGNQSKMVVCGEGPDTEYCRSLVADLSIQDRVSFVGWKSETEKSKYLVSTDVLIFPSIGPESFGLVGLEAMFYRKPIIAFNAGGVSEWLKSGQNGYLVEWGNIDQMSQAMSRLSSFENIRKELGENGKRILESEFSLEKHLTSLIQAYSSVKR